MRILELFAGYGSQALALEYLGIPFTSDISEIDKYAIDAYNQLHGNTHNWGDICKIDETQLPYYDLITYSSPCQDFSVAGLGKGGDIDSGTRSSLLWQCERIIRAVRPKYLLMENVKNLVGERHKHNFIKWLKVLESLGYQNFWKVINAKDYGVPQNRERVFVVSILGGGQYLFPNPVKLEKRLKDVLESDVDEKYYLSDKILKGFLRHNDNHLGRTGFVWSPRDVEGYATTIRANSALCPTDNTVLEPLVCASRGRNPDNPSNRTAGSPTEQRIEINNSGCSNTLTSVQKDNYLLEPKIIQSSHGFNKGNVYKNAPTITSSGYENNNFLNYNYRIRKLTPRECWRLMGVKDADFDKLHGISNAQLYKMAGNSIVVNVLMAIFQNIFDNKNDTKGQLQLL